MTGWDPRVARGGLPFAPSGSAIIVIHAPAPRDPDACVPAPPAELCSRCHWYIFLNSLKTCLWASVSGSLYSRKTAQSKPFLLHTSEGHILYIIKIVFCACVLFN